MRVGRARNGTALVLSRLVPRIGARRMTLGALVLACVVLALFPAVPGISLWFPLRFLLGAASEVLFVLAETWVNQLSDESTRVRSMATYIAALSGRLRARAADPLDDRH